MSTMKFRFILRELGVVRFWNSWTHKYIFNNVVKRCMRDRGVREVIQRFRHTILRPKRTLLLSATAAYKSHNDDSFDCNQGISDDELQVINITLSQVQQHIFMKQLSKRGNKNKLHLFILSSQSYSCQTICFCYQFVKQKTTIAKLTIIFYETK